ncbi:DUF938 domain-containing protein [Aestuariispira insulae]|uniref:Uncharacterized protein DUF938 n=1 Tax=Aestuariispira insulae TaxID=1461337 RepID=A0A3D9HPP2_9PROT|nr:DUF938 domain-containing protein [Aestuariispira insulae]RED51483.1 uncharacterized protein DUF938 [Aestuariispira insulae]
MEDKRLFAPAVARNREAIGAVIDRIAPEKGQALEIASGSGEHVVHMAGLRPNIIWQPTDIDDNHLASIDAHRVAEGLGNILPAKCLDVFSDDWPVEKMDLIFNANMIHIAPWSCCEGLMAGVGRCLSTAGHLVMYGPYKRGGDHTADSNRSFDENLRSRNSLWGVRDLEAVIEQAEMNGLDLQEVVDMPANNLCVIYRKV